MRLHRLTLRSFRGVAERTVTFAERGITVVEGPNEAGKSSLAEALDLLLGYQAHSKAQAVRRVQPVGSDVGSEVEAELSCGPYRLTYAKRFHRDHATTLLVEEPAERRSPSEASAGTPLPRTAQLSGGAAHDRMRALLAEHVDEALWRALRISQDVPLAQADLSGQTSLAAALDAAAGARVGGEREAALFDRVREAYEHYHTPTGQPSKTRRELAEAEEATRADVAEAQQALRDVEDDVERVAELSRALEALVPRVADARARAADAEARWQAVDRRRIEAERLALDAARAADDRDRAAAAVERREARVARCRDADRELAEARAALARHEPALQAAAHDVAEAGRRADELRDAVAQAREAARDREAALQAQRDADTLAALEDRIERIERAEAEAAAADVQLASGVDDEALAAVEDALADVHRARAVADADAPTLTIRRLGAVDVTVDGEPAADDTLQRPVTAATAVRIGDLAEVLVDPGRDAQARREQVAAAEATLTARLAEAGCADVAEARSRNRAAADAAATRDRARRTTADLVGDEQLTELRERRDVLAARAAATSTSRSADGPDAAREAAEAARTLVEQREHALAAAEAALRDARARREALSDATARLQVRVEAAEQAVGDGAAALEEDRRAGSDDALAAALEAAERAAADAADAHREASDRLAAIDPDGAQAVLEEAAAVRDRLDKEQRALEDDLRDVRARIAVRGEEGLHDRLAEAERRLADVEADRARLESRAAAARLLHDEMAARREDATRAYAAPLREKLERLGRIVYGDDFAVELGDDLRTTRRTLRGTTLDFEDLSTGAREQLALLSRLAVASLVARDGGVPLVIDDALGSSDPARLERLGAALRVGARDAQVIVLTCVPDRYRGVGDATVVRLT